MITVALVDDDPMVRTGLSLILGGDAGRRSLARPAMAPSRAGRSRWAETPVDVAPARHPDAGAGRPGRAGAARDGIPPRPKVIVLTTFNTDDYVLRALKLGADGFLLKDADPARLVEAIERVAAGEPALSPEVTST